MLFVVFYVLSLFLDKSPPFVCHDGSALLSNPMERFHCHWTGHPTGSYSDIPNDSIHQTQVGTSLMLYCTSSKVQHKITHSFFSNE